MMVHTTYLSLQAASMVLQSGPALGSEWRTCATKVSCAVCMMNAQCDTFSPMLRKDRNLGRRRRERQGLSLVQSPNYS